MEKEKTYGVWAVRSAASIFGRAESWCKEAGRPLEFASQETAEAYAVSYTHLTLPTKA